MTEASRALSVLTATTVVLGLGVTGAAAAGTPGTAAATERPALAVLGPFTFTGATQAMRSTTHKALRVSLFATDRPTAGTEVAPDAMTVTVSRRHSPERHSWAFELPTASDFSYDEDARSGALTTGSAIEPFGALSLTLTAVGRGQSVGCGRTRADNQQVRVTGTMRFDTRSTGSSRWGVVGGSHRITFTGRSIVSILHPADKLCGSVLPPCVAASSWLAHKTTPGTSIANDEVILQELASTVGGSTRYAVSGERITQLARPVKAVRTDTTTLTVAHTTFGFPAQSARVTVPSSAPSLTGSARLSSTSETESVGLACGTFPQTSTTTMWTAAYRNAAQPLALHEQIEGTYRLPNDVTSAEITRIVPN
jgi:hypothetical protein